MTEHLFKLALGVRIMQKAATMMGLEKHVAIGLTPFAWNELRSLDKSLTECEAYPEAKFAGMPVQILRTNGDD